MPLLALLPLLRVCENAIVSSYSTIVMYSGSYWQRLFDASLIGQFTYHLETLSLLHSIMNENGPSVLNADRIL